MSNLYDLVMTANDESPEAKRAELESIKGEIRERAEVLRVEWKTLDSKEQTTRLLELLPDLWKLGPEWEYELGRIDKVVKLGKRALKAMMGQATQMPTTAGGGDIPKKAKIGGLSLKDGLYGNVEIVKDADGNNKSCFFPVSSFSLELVERLRLDDGSTVLVCDAVVPNGPRVRLSLPGAAFVSDREFKKALNHEALQFVGDSNDVQSIKSLVAEQDAPEKAVTEISGYHVHGGEPLWVVPGLTMGADGVQEAPALVKRGATPPAPTGEADPQTIKNMLAMNEPGVMRSILGWFFASPLKTRLAARFPVLWVWGEKGSGKTITLQQMWNAFGWDSSSLTAGDITRFALVKTLAGSNAVPVWLDEYKGDIGQDRQSMIARFIRESYDGKTTVRGKADQTTVEYTLCAPLVIAGEMPTDEEAVRDRLIQVEIEKASQTPARKTTLETVKSAQLAALGRDYAQWALTWKHEEAWKGAESDVSNALGGRNIPDRVREGLRVVAFGLRAVSAYAKQKGLDLGALDMKPVIDLSLSDIGAASGRSEDALDRMVGSLHELKASGRLHKDGAFLNAKKDRLCVRLDDAWNAYMRHCREVGKRETVTNHKAILKMAEANKKRSGYVVNPSGSVRTDAGAGGTMRVMLLDLAQALREGVDVTPWGVGDPEKAAPETASSQKQEEPEEAAPEERRTWHDMLIWHDKLDQSTVRTSSDLWM